MFRRFIALALVVVSATIARAAETSATAPMTRETILPVLERNADAQIAALSGKTPIDWVPAAFYVGLSHLTHVSDNPKYHEALLNVADKNRWMVNQSRGNRRFHADDQAIGQMYIDLAASMVSSMDVQPFKKDAGVLKPLIDEETALLGQLAHFDPKVQNPTLSDANAKIEIIPWWWCDALFMNPPVLARLSAVTGDRKYLEAMDKAWDQTHELLWDKDEHLYYRDNRFLTRKSEHGKKIFWSRGNGWVVGGLCEVLTYMPEDPALRAKYSARLKEMCDKLLTLQGDDGLWRASLEDPEDADHPETSGSAFFTYAFLWGMNHGVLEKAKFEAPAKKAWAALNTKLRTDGLLGYVQQVGFDPKPTTANETQLYGNGAFLLAGTEMMKFIDKK